MINKEFKKNWQKILKFNKNRDELVDPKKIREYVRIPLSPISLNANLLYHFFKIFYPKFINDQQNILDIIISETEKKNKIFGLYLYKTKKAGIHETIESLPYDLIRIKDFDIDNLDEIFNKIQSKILKEKNIRISSIRVFKKEVIDLINKHCEGIAEISIYEFLNRIFDLIYKLFKQNLILIYPKPILFHFLTKSAKLIDQIELSSIFKFIEQIIPEVNTSLLINGNNIKIVVLLQKIVQKSGKSKLTLKFFTLEELDIKIEDLNINETLITIQHKLKTDDVYYFSQNDIISLISDVFELAIPIKKENLKFLLQKLLFGFRSFDTHWIMVPRPKIYNPLSRFIIRLFGFNLNFKKISHWTIPDLIFNYIDFYFGLNSKVLFIITDQTRNKKIKHAQSDSLKKTYSHSFLLEIENSVLNSVKLINKETIFSSNNSSLYSIKENLEKNMSSISAVIVFDKLILQKIIKSFILEHSKLSLIPRFKILKLLKNKNYFSMFPEFPFYEIIKKKSSMSLLKLVLPILIDKHEF